MKTIQDKILTRIPFDGFYNSFISYNIDNHIEQEIDYHNDELGIKCDYDSFDININYEILCKSYLDHLEEYIFDNMGIEIDLIFESIASPKFYNYSTDLIYAYVDRSVLALLVAEYGDDYNKFIGVDFAEWSYDDLESLFPCEFGDIYMSWDSICEACYEAIEMVLIKGDKEVTTN